MSELDALYQSFPGSLDAACFTLFDPMAATASSRPRPSSMLPLAPALHDFLAAREVASYKFPDRLLVVREIPRDAQGRVLRNEILRRV